MAYEYLQVVFGRVASMSEANPPEGAAAEEELARLPEPARSAMAGHPARTWSASTAA